MRVRFYGDATRGRCLGVELYFADRRSGHLCLSLWKWEWEVAW